MGKDEIIILFAIKQLVSALHEYEAEVNADTGEIISYERDIDD